MPKVYRLELTLGEEGKMSAEGNGNMDAPFVIYGLELTKLLIMARAAGGVAQGPPTIRPTVIARNVLEPKG